jgi:phosphoribosylanthranilate isomerase
MNTDERTGPIRTRIKICGVRDAETALVAAECGADSIGLVFVSSSPRCVSIDEAYDIQSVLPAFVTSVGLFMNPKADDYLTTMVQADLDLGQLHGKESEPLVREIGPDLIKAIRYSRETIEADLRKWSRIDELDAVLVDGGDGGTGEKADWEHLATVVEACDHPVILAGGLTPENVGEAIRLVKPYAVDVSSGVESEPGLKDPAKIAAFCRAVREADHLGS